MGLVPDTGLEEGGCWLCDEPSAAEPFRLDRDKDKRLGICNQSTGAKNLPVDEVLQRSERQIVEVPMAQSKAKLHMGLFLILVCIVGLAILLDSMR